MNLPPEYGEQNLKVFREKINEWKEVVEGKLDKDEYDERLDEVNPFINEPVIEPEAD